MASGRGVPDDRKDLDFRDFGKQVLRRSSFYQRQSTPVTQAHVFVQHGGQGARARARQRREPAAAGLEANAARHARVGRASPCGLVPRHPRQSSRAAAECIGASDERPEMLSGSLPS